jgi:hypothetical protein
MTAQKRERKSQLIRASLLAVDWKTRFGHSVQIGIDGHVDDLNKIAFWLSENRDGEIIAVDDLKHKSGSFLDGLKAQVGAHYHVPPTMQGNVRLYPEAPALHNPILFLHAATSNSADIEPIIDNIEPGTIVLGSVDACRTVLDAAQCKAQPLYFHGEDLALRVVA